MFFWTSFCVVERCKVCFFDDFGEGVTPKRRGGTLSFE